MNELDPFTEPGLWLVTTTTDEHLMFDSLDPTGVTVVPVTIHANADEGGIVWEFRDAEDKQRLISVMRPRTDGPDLQPGISFGAAMTLHTALDDPRLSLAQRRTSPVRAIARLLAPEPSQEEHDG